MDTRQDGAAGKKHNRALLIAIALIVLIVGACVEGYAMYGSVMSLRTKAQATMNSLRVYVDGVRKGDQEKLMQSAQEVRESAHEIQREMGSLPWSVASVIPVLGSDVRSAQTVVDVLVDASDEVLVPLAQGTELMSLSSLMQDGSVNMRSLEDLASVVRKVEPVMSASSKTLESLPPAHMEQVGSIIESAREAIASAGDAARRISPLIGDLPTLLGANGQQKNYLIVASNIGELHAAGGYVGSVGVLTVVDGQLSLGAFTDIRNVLPVDSVSAGASAEEIQIFGERVDTHHGDHNMIPDFSRVGQLYWNIWDSANGLKLDGVIGVDPIFLQRVLELIGEVDTSYGVSVDGENAASTIINECLFFGWEPTQCDDFYSEVASKSFDKLLSRLGSLDTFSFMETVSSSAAEGRCNVWVSDEATEGHIQSAGLGWELPHEISAPTLGVFASDLSTSKAAYYLSLDTTVDEPVSNPDGTKTYSVASVMRHNMDRSLVDDDLPGYIVTGWSTIAETRSKVELMERVSLIAPEGGTIANVQVTYWDSVVPAPEAIWSEHRYQGNDTWTSDIRIDAGESCIITYTVTVPSEAIEPLQLRQSPVVPREVRGD